MPQPVAIAIRLTEQQKRLLEQITRARTNPYRLVQRAQLRIVGSLGNDEYGNCIIITINTGTGAIMANKMAKCSSRMGASEIRRYRG